MILKTKILILIPVIYLLTNCGSKVPIADASKAVEDDRIVGCWIPLENHENEKADFLAFKFNEKEYLIELRSTKFKQQTIERDTTHARAYIVKVLDKPFLNVQLIDSLNIDERRYFFYNYQFKNDSTMMVQGLKGIDSISINNFEHSKDLYEFIKNNIDNPNLYEEEFTLKKIK